MSLCHNLIVNNNTPSKQAILNSQWLKKTGAKIFFPLVYKKKKNIDKSY